MNERSYIDANKNLYSQITAMHTTHYSMFVLVDSVLRLWEEKTERVKVEYNYFFFLLLSYLKVKDIKEIAKIIKRY
jgi:hypothetical protein